ncbi:hypothetical protein A3D00_04160 [Candidatus Woesebacteria bacterium RIFCSPHIGHO2_02_FULL_38_9]|uniref:Iron transporter n=1 Tax=Candidatus Woesebacteria bacterium RIFCSPHIGHO2_01_FULL_39_28 TaxID=1802496 RepID=A0A1F7YEJ3_9BACT|nr:MAG: hypothetical protein A2627_05120 [Candidatus Woesebacteria bacterium RIFCSPHIGHO2_01_FULL_39_28]OGM33759.1 MAG: hypothetical protein A3D00_04160 [Candidatus Woesebacteria bacterium RIFCSPHIGHO2_02_FULL_38_9]OGM57574.1 MAG: hypothetical protein A3A50_06235 [Candidatus Woesebacteria bacterium RIFCSPLOWO2_01_FULL_38_20]
MTKLLPLSIKELPKPPSLKKLLGPSFILLGLGLGSGELILWPYLTANYGLGIIWAAILGITFQFFINMEIARYTLVAGESIFVGLTRKFGKVTPYWFIFSTLTPWIWPGIAASAGKVLSAALGIRYTAAIGILLLILIGLILSLGKVVYKTQEKTQKAIILVGIPFILIMTLSFTKSQDWSALGMGLFGRGEGYWFLPMGLPFATFLAAFAYAGAGGNLNLAQSLYIKEKGYGMGKFGGRISGLFGNKQKDLKLTGVTFEPTGQNLINFKKWWKRINIEHALIFWITGAFTIILLSLLSYTTVYKNAGVETSINFVIREAGFLTSKLVPFLGELFLVIVSIMLFGTQFSVTASNSRIMSENLVITNPDKYKIENSSYFFYIFLWAQILSGIIIFSLGFTEPLSLVVIGAVLNAFSMFIYSGLVLWLNLTSLAKPLRPSFLRTFAVGSAFLFYGAFSIFTISQFLFR